MAKVCSKCEKQLSFRDSFVWEGQPICKSCLQELEQGLKPQQADRVADAVSPPKVSESETLFLYIPTARLVLLSIVSCGLYEAYWIYRNWRFIKERQGLGIKPFWRGIFGILFCHRLLREIHGDKEAALLLEPSFSPGGLATGWVILIILANLISRAPGIEALIIAYVMPSYLFLLPVQNYINAITEKRSPGISYYGWSIGHLVCLVIGITVWVLTFYLIG